MKRGKNSKFFEDVSLFYHGAWGAHLICQGLRNCVLNIYCALNCNTFKLLLIDHISRKGLIITTRLMRNEIMPTFIGRIILTF